MNQDALRVVPLTPARREDYLRFFDHERGPAFADNPAWAACYCHFHHVSPQLAWEVLDGGANRLAMDARIACAEMEGYLAYRGDAMVGWLNAQPRNKLPHCDARIGVPAPPLPVPAHEAAAIVCFVVAPAARGNGVVRALLAAALDDLSARGVRIVDAYPRDRDQRRAPARDHYRGPRSLFTAAGFEVLETHGHVVVMRKHLAGSAA